MFIGKIYFSILRPSLLSHRYWCTQMMTFSKAALGAAQK